MPFIAPEDDLAAARSGVTMFGDPVLGSGRPTARQAQDIGDSVIAGLQSSSGGLIARGKLAEVTMPEDAPWYHRAAAGIGGLVGDAPAMVAGGYLGIPVGGAIGGALTKTPHGAAIGAMIGSGAGSFGVPMALRDGLVTAYNHNQALSWEGVWDIAQQSLKGFSKGAAIGAFTLGAGAAVGRTVGSAVAPGVGITMTGKTAGRLAEGSALGAELATLTTTAAAMEGHLPTWQDFMDNAILLGGAKAAVKVAQGMRNSYAETGRTPQQQLADAMKDPEIRKALNGDGTINYDMIGEMVGGVSHLRGIVSSVAREYDRHGPDAARAKLEEFANAAPESSGFSKELREIPNFVDKLYLETESQVLAARGLLRQGIPQAYAPQALAERIRAAFNPEDLRPGKIAEAFDAVLDTNTPKLDGKLLTDVVRTEYIVDEASHQGVLRAVTEAFETEINTQRRGEVPNTQTLREAKQLIAGGELGPVKPGTATNAAETAARLVILRSATGDVVNKLQVLRETPVAEQTPLMRLQALASIETLSKLKAEADGILAEWGRTGQMVRELKRDPSVLDSATALLKLAERKGPLQDIATFAANLKDPAQLAKFARDYTQATSGQKVIEAWRAAIFSGPQTWAANILGNVTKWTVDIKDAAVSATITAGRQALKGDPLTMAQYKARAFAPLYGLQLAVLDGMHLVAEGKALVEANGTLAGVKKILTATRDTLLKEDDKIDVHKRANEGIPGSLVGAAFGMLKLQDMPFRTVGERAEAHIIAVDRAVKESGFHPGTAEFKLAVKDFLDNPTKDLNPKEIAATEKRIADAGAESVFSQRLGQTTERLSSAISGTAWELLFPARRTPANLLSWAVQHTPGLNFFSGRWREDFAAGGERQSKAIARVVVGTAIGATALGLVQNGMLTGGGLFDKEMSGTKQGADWQPYSLFINGKYYSIQRIEPVSKLLMLTGDLHEIMNSPKITPEDKGKAAAMLALAFANATISTTYLSGLSNTMRAALDPERYGQALVEQYATSLVPKILSQPVTMADPFKREVDGAIDAIQSQLPFLREKLLPKRDVWGQPAENDKWFAVMPVQVSTASEDKVKTEAVRLQVAIAPAPKYVTERGPFNPREQRTELTDAQKDVFKQVAGEKAMEILAPIVNSPDWESIPDFAKAAIYKDVIEGARKQGQYYALPPDAATRENVRRRIVDKIIRQTNEVAAPEKRIKAE